MDSAYVFNLNPETVHLSQCLKYYCNPFHNFSTSFQPLYALTASLFDRL